MKVHRNEIIVYRNETFTMNKDIQNRDGSPYIISSRLTNPYFLITVSNSRYGQNNRYVHNKWLNLKDTPRFEITRPVNLSEIGYDEFEDLPAGYEGDETLGYANKAVFTDGTNYKYWKYNTATPDLYDGEWVDYKCTIHTSYSSQITSQWSEQTYQYGILLVSGESTIDNLNAIATSLRIDNSDDQIKLYETLFDIDPTLVAHIKSPDRPIVEFDEVRSILPPTKLFVQSNMKGMMT